MLEGLDTASPIYLPYPVNTAHPLNRGRVAWFLSLPGLEGGNAFYDILGLYAAAFTGMTSSYGWRGPARPSGYGSLLVGAPGVYASAGSQSPLQPVSAVSMAAWAISFGSQAAYGAVCSQTYASTHTAPYYAFKIGVNYNGNGAWECELSTNLAGDNVVYGPQPVTGAPTRLLMTYDGTTQSFYVNGLLFASAGMTGTINYGSGSHFRIGTNAGGGEYFTGTVDDISVWNRTLSAAEVEADYELSQRGYPGVLNRFDTRRFSLPAAAAALRRPLAPLVMRTDNRIFTLAL